MTHRNIFNFLTMIILATFISSCTEDEPEMTTEVTSTSTYMYSFNNGQVVPSAPYKGQHRSDFSADLQVEGFSDGTSKITVTLKNTLEGETYMIHAHDAADPSTTPNGTPYKETPNGDLLMQMGKGTGGDLVIVQETMMSAEEIMNYEGFFVVHDPLQDISTTDISTYLIVGAFAETQPENKLMSKEFDYSFNTGQLVMDFAYDGMHNEDLMAKLKVEELGNGESRISVWLMNTINGEMYMVHAHDAADPASTPIGTPYNESPNGDVCSLMIQGNGNTSWSSQYSIMTFEEITTTYEGFFVVHDPLQPIDTTDPTTYVVLGLFARS